MLLLELVPLVLTHLTLDSSLEYADLFDKATDGESLA